MMADSGLWKYELYLRVSELVWIIDGDTLYTFPFYLLNSVYLYSIEWDKYYVRILDVISLLFINILINRGNLILQIQSS